jgi:PIN domain
VDWHKQLGVADVTLVLAPVVVSEWMHHKWSGARREKARAKSVIKKVLSLGLSSTPVRLRPGVQAMALDEEPSDALLAQHRLQARSNDDRLLASFLKFRDEHPQARVLILSADGGLSTKARSRKIELVVPDDVLALRDEPDDTERELEKTRRELAAAKSVMPDLCLTFGEGNKHGQFEVSLLRLCETSTRRH